MARKLAILMVVVGLIATLAPVQSFAGPDQAVINAWYEAAKAEGEVLWQVGGRLKQFVPIAKYFEKKYPGIKCKVFSSAASAIATRVITEANAKNLSVDVGGTMLHLVQPLVKRDLLVKYDWTKTSDSDPKDILVNNSFVITNDHPPVWVRNTNMVSEADAPKTWQEVLDPKWAGSKISIRAMGAAVGGLFPGWLENPQKIENFIKSFQKQKVVPGTRYSLVMSRVATGETPIAIVMGAEVKLRQAEGAPISALPISPTANAPMGSFIPKGSPHPNAAKLLLNFFASSEGRQVWTKYTKGGLAYPPDASPLAQLLFENKIKYHRVTLEEVDGYLRFSKMVEEAMVFTPK